METATLYNNSLFSDIRLLFDDGCVLPAHRVVLARISHFVPLLGNSELHLPGISSTAARSLIARQYGVEIPGEPLPEEMELVTLWYSKDVPRRPKLKRRIVREAAKAASIGAVGASVGIAEYKKGVTEKQAIATASTAAMVMSALSGVTLGDEEDSDEE